MKRLPIPDLLKGLAIILMIQVHVTELFIDHAGRESIFGKISLFLGGPFTAMVFMIVMGYFIAKNNKSLQSDVIRGLKIIFLGFLLNVALNFHLLLKIIRDNWPYDPWEYIFGVDILFLAGISIIFLAFLNIVPKKVRGWFMLILIFVIAGFTPYVNEKLMSTERNYLIPFVGGTFSWSYFPIFPWLIYPLTGFGFFLFEEKIRDFTLQYKTASAIIIFVIAAGVILYLPAGSAITINLHAYYHHSWPFAVWALGLIIMWSMLIKLSHTFIIRFQAGHFLIWLGKNITLIYVVQWIIIGNISTAIYQTQPMKRFLPWVTIIFILSVAITRSLEKLRTMLKK